jgi:outer membrane lipoprotein-sorting protein
MNQALLSRRLAVVAIVLTVGVVAAGAAAGLPGMGDADQPSGDDVLEQAETRYDAAETIAGTAEVTVSNDTDSTTATVEYAAKAPDKVAYTVSKNGDTYEAGSNGSVAWAVGPDDAYARDLPTEGELDEYRQPTEPVPETNVTATLVETTELSLPRYESGEFSNATLVSRADGQAVFQQYDTASGPVSVITADGAAQYLDRLESNTTVTVDEQSATAVTRDGRATVVWTTDGTTTAVAVTGTVADAQAAANGL